MKNHIKNISLWLALSLYIITSYALNSDNAQPLTVSADNADINNHSGIGKYIGNVKARQGTSHLTAATAITYSSKTHQLILAEIIGDSVHPAHFWTVTEANKPALHAYAKTIKFYPQKHEIHLLGNAKVTQGADSYSAPEIRYNTQTQHIVSGHHSNQRTTIIIHPTTSSHRYE